MYIRICMVIHHASANRSGGRENISKAAQRLEMCNFDCLDLQMHFAYRSKEYLRDCLFYAVSIMATAFILLDGQIVVWEGVLMCSLYVVYVVIVIYYDAFLKLVGAGPLNGEGADGDDSSQASGIACKWQGPDHTAFYPLVCGRARS